MKAINLEQALAFFDPRHPLSGQDLRMWFIARPRSPRRILSIALQQARQPIKVLFLGHRGSGKTTEINQLAEDIRARYYTIGFSVFEITGRTTPEYEDLMLAIGTQVMRACIKDHLIEEPLTEPLRRGWEDLRDWWQNRIITPSVRPRAAEPSIYLEVATLLGQIEVGARQSSVTRDEVRFRINQEMPELIQRLNWVIDQAEASCGKRLLIVVEDLDKVDLDAAIKIFRDHAPTITAPQASMIYTCPIAIRHSDHYNTIRLSFDEVRFHPNIATRHVDGTPDEEGIALLRALVLARLEERLIEAEALDLIIQASGGVPVWLVRLVRDATLYALKRNAQAQNIQAGDAHEAIRELRQEGLAPLTRRDLEVLRARHRDRQFSNDADEQRLLYNGSLIEYTNKVQWCDAHPALWSLLEQPDDGNADPASGPGG